MKVRIGIDVGGTFTDAVAINNDTYELIGQVKVPTTHQAKEGVAAGIVIALRKIMDDCNIKPEDVTFIAHGTTQATNALLEGDVAKVGIMTLGQGLAIKTKMDTAIGDIELASGKNLSTVNTFVNIGAEDFDAEIKRGIADLKDNGMQVLVATEAFSVDKPENENHVLDICSSEGIPATAGNDVSKLYGLKIRTRTAAINASILPKMLDAANLTESSIKNAKIEAPLMVMRCDGGVMTVDEVRNRPILTILSGPAAGVAGALMYEKLTDGIFLEVGGTSTDISCVKDGSVVVRYAEVGGHKTYLNSLDVRTVGIGGGSMVEIRDGKAVDVGPRSAHIANLDYEVYTDAANISNPVLKTVSPKPGDAPYAYVECDNGKKYALTLSGAANIAGYVKAEHYAIGNREAAEKAWEPLAKNMRLSVLETAKKVLQFAALKNGRVVESLIADYGLDKSSLTLVGGGGGAAVVVPHLAETMGCKSKIAKNACVISPIGVALALVRDMVERTVSNPTDEEILSIRREAINKAIANGANPATIECRVEVDVQHQRVRAVAMGATELRTKELSDAKMTDEQLKEIVAENLGTQPSQVALAADNGMMCAAVCEIKEKKFLLFGNKKTAIRLIDRDGVIRLQRTNGSISTCVAKDWLKTASLILEKNRRYTDGVEEVPNLFVVAGKTIIDLSGMMDSAQIMAVLNVEMKNIGKEEQLIMVCTSAAENIRG